MSTTLAILLFGATYLGLLIFSKYRAYIAFGSAAIFVALGALPLGKVFSEVDWNVIMMIAGTMGTVALFIESRMPARLADLIINRVPNVKWAIIALSMFAGIISAFVDNVATVLMVAPVALGIAKRLKISPVPSIIAIAIASNLQGAATLVGDTTSILLGGAAHMTFADFFFLNGKVSMFWIVQIAAIAATIVLWIQMRKYKQRITNIEPEVVQDYFPTILLLGTIALLILASFFAKAMPADINGYICVGVFLIGLLRGVIAEKGLGVIKRSIKEIDFFTLLLLASLFVVIGSIRNVGVIDMIADFFQTVSKGNLFLMYTLIVWFSVLISAFIDNIPYVATMLPVVAAINVGMGMQGSYLLFFGLLCGATLGGNLTPIGASANIAGLGILRKEGYEVSVGTYMKMSVPYTLAAVTTGYILIWFIWR
jgi:Na+/H+ antiporter NhaD/arsenite permease-like protein